MEANYISVALDRGLDFVTPPMMAETGTLLDAVNYELTAALGYARYEGYERCDGSSDGGISGYYSVTAIRTASLPVTPSPVVGDAVYRLTYKDSSPAVDNVLTENFIGVVLDWAQSGSTYTLIYSPIGDNAGLGNGATLRVGEAYVTTTSAVVDGRTTALSPDNYLVNIRTYSQALRELVQSADANIAGVHYSRDHIYEVVDAPSMSVDTTTFGLTVGMEIAYHGKVYAVLELDDDGLVLRDTGRLRITTDDDIVRINLDDSEDVVGEFVGNFGTSSTKGYIVKRKNVREGRGATPLSAAYSYRYIDGSGSLPFPTGLGHGPYTVTVNPADGTGSFSVHVHQITHDGGDFSSGDATGVVSYSIISKSGTVRDWSWVGDEIVTDNGSLTISAVLDVGSLAGTQTLQASKTGASSNAGGLHYQFLTANFYGREDLKQFYGCYGAGRAFWCDGERYGNIVTSEDAALDIPKYVAFHAGNRLALGFAAGSVMFSVVGEPCNFSGLQGAIEVAIGDGITGLVEAFNDSTIVFGKRTIRRVVGSSPDDFGMQTVSSSSGALDYTAAVVGTTVVFTSPTGVSTLEQTQAYGEFVGASATAPIYTWLNPRLAVDTSSIEPSGVVCGYAVRAKNQYRLVLRNGDIVAVTFTTNGPKTTKLRFGVNYPDLRIPLAWDSSVGDDGTEWLLMVWDYDAALAGIAGVVGTIPDPQRLYRLDYGWGFDGKVFDSFFEMLHAFPTKGYTYNTIRQVRMHGLGYGIASLEIRSSGLEKDYDQDYHKRSQDISMPTKAKILYKQLQPVTAMVDEANWGLGVKLRVRTSLTPGGDNTEPKHVCQVMQLYTTEGTGDI